MNERWFGRQQDNSYDEELGVMNGSSICFVYFTVLTDLVDLYCKIHLIYSLHYWSAPRGFQG